MARRLGMGASSAARPGDRLEAGGHVVRLEDPRDRGVLVVEPTAAGREPVDRVMRRRRAGPTRILGRLSSEERAGPASGLWRLHDAAGEEHAAETAGPPSL